MFGIFEDFLDFVIHFCKEVGLMNSSGCTWRQYCICGENLFPGVQ